MKKQFSIFVLSLLAVLTASAQGTQIASSPLYYSGSNVGVGTQYPEGHIHIDASTSGSNLKLGSNTMDRSLAWLATDGNTGLTTLQSWWAGHSLNGLNLGRLALNPNGGRVGIGTNAPERLFHVDGGSDGTSMMLGSTAIGGRTSLWINSDGTTGKTSLQAWWAGIGTGAAPILLNPTVGNVGIGTFTPGTLYKLVVEGTIGAREVVVNTAAWPDYVFDKEYSLRTPAELRKFISDNHHLPDVPSEKEVTDHGQNLGEVNAALLRKIEELTLYMLNQHDQMETMRSEIDRIKELIK